MPKRGMGWYHGKQMLDGSCPSAKLTTVVEPYFLGDGADSPPGKTFKAWADEMTAKHGTKFVKSIGDVEIKVRLSSVGRASSAGSSPTQLTLRTPTCWQGPTLALISGRTADNPRLLKEVPPAIVAIRRRPAAPAASAAHRLTTLAAPAHHPRCPPPPPHCAALRRTAPPQVIEAGATHVFLEKPGAPSVAELQEMRAYAASKGVPVYMGYNKNVTPYVQKVRDRR